MTDRMHRINSGPLEDTKLLEHFMYCTLGVVHRSSAQDAFKKSNAEVLEEFCFLASLRFVCGNVVQSNIHQFPCPVWALSFWRRHLFGRSSRLGSRLVFTLSEPFSP